MGKRFRILKCENIDCEKWQRSVSDMDIYHQYNYLNLTTNNRWKAAVWGDYDFVFPYYEKWKYRLIPYICMPPFVQKFDNSRIPRDYFLELISHLRKSVFRMDLRVKINYGIGDEVKQNFWIDKLGHTYESLSSQYDYLVTKNLKNQDSIKIELSDALEAYDFLSSHSLAQDLIMKKNAKTCKRLLESEYCRSMFARNQLGDRIGLLSYLLFNRCAYLIFPYQTEQGRKLQAMTHLIDNIVRDQTIEKIDFEGSSIATIATFYERFGAKKETYFKI